MKDDIVIAQQIVSNSYNNFYEKTHFHSESEIYKTTNERISCYMDYLTGKKNVLSVIASSEQILNCILNGTLNIDCFDISTFPKYFLYLKLAAILTLSRKQYINFFYGDIVPNDKYDEYYDLIREELSGDNRRFWDSLFNYFDWCEIYNSTLFSSDLFFASNVIRENMYLQGKNYDKLRSLIRGVNFNIHTGDIMDLVGNFKSEYDLVYLSNIINYVDVGKYLDILPRFNLSDKGVVLTYFYALRSGMMDYFSGSNFFVDRFNNLNAGVIVYHK